MSFFPPLEDEPEPPEHEEWTAPPWFQPPQEELPGLVADGRLLARTDRLVVHLGAISVFSVGVELLIRGVIRRTPAETAREWHDVHGIFFGGFPHQRLEPRFGMALPDGSRVIAGAGSMDPHEAPAAAVLHAHSHGGSGGSNRIEQNWRLWLWPSPPEHGTLELVVAWERFGIAETRLPIDLEPIAAARRHVRPLWDDAPPGDSP